MIERRRYRNPPIDEALCEFRFEPDSGWDSTLADRLHAELQVDYPTPPRERRVVEVGLQVKGSAPTQMEHKEAVERVQLLSDDERRIVGVGKALLSIHMLRPYQAPGRPFGGGWEELRSRVEKALDAYSRVAQPTGVRRIGVRYVNRIVFPCPAVQLEDYVKCSPPIPPELPQRIGGSFARSEIQYADDIYLVLSQGTTSDSSGNAAYVLDLDVIWQGQSSISLAAARRMVEDLKGHERLAFEAIITDKAREVFDAA